MSRNTWYEDLHSLIRQYEMGFLSPMEYLVKTAKVVREIECRESDNMLPAFCVIPREQGI